MSIPEPIIRRAVEDGIREMVARMNYQLLHLGINPEFPPNYWLHHSIEEMNKVKPIANGLMSK